MINMSLHSLQTIQLPKIQSKNECTLSYNDIRSYDFSSFTSDELYSDSSTTSKLNCNNILAFSTNDQEIYLYEPNSNNLFSSSSSSSSYLVSPIKCKTNVTILRWKPNSPSFVTTLDNGHIYMWSLHHRQRNNSSSINTSKKSSCNNNPLENESLFQEDSSYKTTDDNIAVVSCTYTNTSIHENRTLNFIVWNELGTCLLSGDDYGLCCVWKPTSTIATHDNNALIMKLIPLIQIHNTSSPLADAVFIPSSYDGTTMFDIDSHDDDVVFCFGDEDGKVFLANTTTTATTSKQQKSRECVEIHSISPSKIHKLLFFLEKRRLLVITESLHIAQIQLDETNNNSKVLSVINVKLSITKYYCREEETLLSFQISWICSGVLACATQDNTLRIWDLQNDENYTLSLDSNNSISSSSSNSVLPTERVLTVAFNPILSYLVAGTNKGKCVVWKYNSNYNEKNRWQLLKPYTCRFQGEILSLQWSKNYSTLLTVTSKETQIVTLKPIRSIFKDDVLAFAKSPNILQIYFIEGSSMELDVGMDMKYYSLSSSSSIDDDTSSSYSYYYVAVCSGKQIRVFRIVYYNTSQQQNDDDSNNKVRYEMISDFPSKSTVIALHEETMFILQNHNLLVMNLKGIMKLSIRLTSATTATSKTEISSSSEKEYPILLDIMNDVMAIVTNVGTLIIIHISRNKNYNGEHKIEKVGKIDDKYSIQSIKCNANGRFISIISEVVVAAASSSSQKQRQRTKHKSSINEIQTTKSHNKDCILLIYDTYKKVLVSSGLDIYSSYSTVSSSKKVPVEHYWDPSEPYILSCVSRIYNRQRTHLEVDVLFISAADDDCHVFIYDTFALENELTSLTGIRSPWLFFIHYDNELQDNATTKTTKISNEIMKDFASYEWDESNKNNYIQFIYNVTIGNIDKALQSIQEVPNNITIWETLAHKSIKLKRLDVCQVCFQHMGHVHGYQALQDAIIMSHKKETKEQEQEQKEQEKVALASAAIQLGMLDDAIDLYHECKRYDLISKLYQAQSRWEEAIETAATFNNHQLKMTHYLYAQHLRQIGEIELAIEQYELSGRTQHKIEILRMLLEFNMVEDMESYVIKQQNNNNDVVELLIWFASYCESIEELEKAKLYYSKAAIIGKKEGRNMYDHLLRLSCNTNRFDNEKACNSSAKRMVKEIDDNTDPAACYYLARQLEEDGEISQSISYYIQATSNNSSSSSSTFFCNNHAIRLCKQYGFDDELTTLVQNSCISSQEHIPIIMSCVEYFENKGQEEKAKYLYQFVKSLTTTQH